MAKTTEVRAVTISLREPGFDIDAERAWAVLGSIVEQHPELSEYSADKRESRFKIAKENAKGEELAHVRISKNFVSVAIREHRSFPDWKEYSEKLLKQILKEMVVSPLSVIHLDNQYYKTWETSVHHGDILYHVFGGPTVYGNAFPKMRSAHFEPNAAFILDEAEKIICAFSFNSRAPSTAKFLKEYPDAYELVVGCGIAKFGNYKPFTKLMDVLEHIHDLSRKYQDQCLEEHFFKPIDDFVEKEESKNSEHRDRDV